MGDVWNDELFLYVGMKLSNCRYTEAEGVSGGMSMLLQESLALTPGYK